MALLTFPVWFSLKRRIGRWSCLWLYTQCHRFLRRFFPVSENRLISANPPFFSAKKCTLIWGRFEKRCFQAREGTTKMAALAALALSLGRPGGRGCFAGRPAMKGNMQQRGKNPWRWLVHAELRHLLRLLLLTQSWEAKAEQAERAERLRSRSAELCWAQATTHRVRRGAKCEYSPSIPTLTSKSFCRDRANSVTYLSTPFGHVFDMFTTNFRDYFGGDKHWLEVEMGIRSISFEFHFQL